MIRVSRWVQGFSGLALAIAGAMAAAPAVKEIAILTGRGELLRFEEDIQKVAASEPKVADVAVISPREVMINAKGVGKATVVVWNGGTPQQFNVTVRDDNSDWEAFVERIRSALPGASVDVNGQGDTIVLTGAVKDSDQAKKAAGMAQTRAKNVVNLLQAPPAPDPRQILLQVKFASIDRVGLNELGFNLFSRNDKTLGETSTQQFQSPRFSQLQFQNQNFSNATVNFADLLNLFIFRPELNIGATIKALQSRNLLQILAEPNLIAIEGKEASFIAGGSFPFPTLTTTSTGGATAPVITVQFKNFGVQLNFTPTITNSGAIHLKVSPEVSSLDFANAVTLQGFLIPAVSQRRADTEVVLKDGESFAIAGLIDNRVIQTLSKVRGVGDIPIFGNLFRSRTTRKSSDELLVVITPRFVRPLSAEEKAKLPDFQEAWLPTLAEQKARKDKTRAAKPEYVGPRGHQEPK
jgi:pilus assembly protein CpaC